MVNFLKFSLLASVLCVAAPLLAQEPGLAKPEILLDQIVTDMPNGDEQQIRVLTATFKPGDKTVFHTHAFPVTVYVLEGAFTLETEGHEPLTLTAGQAMVELPHVEMTGYNRSVSDPLRVIIFYVSQPDTPFLDKIS
jgi:quercetin dioxygenase-like cupin family protein